MEYDWKTIHNAQAKIVYELSKKIRAEKRALKMKHEIECENMLIELLEEQNNTDLLIRSSRTEY